MDGNKIRLSKGRVMAALALSVLHVLAMLGAEYQAGNLNRIEFDRFFFVNYAVFLSPVAILFLLSFFRYVGLALFGAPILVFFILRMHHVWEFYGYGINSMASQKGDGLGFFQMAFDMVASLMLAAVLAIGLVAFLVHVLERHVLRRPESP
jgi:hypothetical protein